MNPFQWTFSRFGVCVLALLWAAQLSGCLFDGAPLEDRQCGTDSDCGDGEVCEDGYCQDGGVEVCGSDADCDDGAFCTVDTCDPGAPGANAEGCVSNDLDVDDGIACTDDICDEGNDRIVNNSEGCPCNTPADARCNDGLDCTSDACDVETFTCVNTALEVGSSCDDGIACTASDACNADGECVGTNEDEACSDGAFCNGAEICNPGLPGADSNGCVAGDEPPVDDGVACTQDFCDEQNDTVVHVINNGFCNDDLFCNGVESCNPDDPGADGATGCLVGPAPDLEDGFSCTVGECDEDSDTVVHIPNNGGCTDGAFCNGEEICDPDGNGADDRGCIAGTPPDFNDGSTCTDDSCDEENDTVINEINGTCVCEPGDEGDAFCLAQVDSPNSCLSYTCSPQRNCVTARLPDDTTCEDGFECTTGDACQAGTCVGVPQNNDCDDGDFCNGAEICQINHPNADPVTGCRDQAGPDLDDGFACTDDICDEQNDTVIHTPVGSRCQDGQFCNGTEVCDTANPNADADGCAFGTPIDPSDGRACTADTCDEATDTIINSPDNAACTDNAFCNGEEVCDPEAQGANPVTGCAVGTPPDLDDNDVCTTDTCDEGNDTIVHTPIMGCGACENDTECAGLNPGVCQSAVCDPENGEADPNGCVLIDEPDDTACTLSCGQINAEGVCDAGACAVPPEGPTGTETCADGDDNDCDGDTDDSDSDCATPDALALTGPQTAPSALDAAGAELTLTPTAGANPATNQARNLYCTSNIVAHEKTFDQPIADILADGEITFLDAEGGASNDPGDAADSGVALGEDLGLELCDGFSMIVGPYAFPSLVTDSNVLTVNMGQRGTGLGATGIMVASYRTNFTSGQFVPLVSTIGAIDGEGVQEYKFLIHQIGGIRNFEIRFDVLDVFGNPSGSCGFIESVRVSTAPSIATNNRANHDFQQWTFNGGEEASAQTFNNSLDPNDFFTTLGNGTHTLETSTEANSASGKGVEWNFQGGAFEAGSVLLPPFTSVDDTVDRSNPLMVDFRASSDGTVDLTEAAQVGYSIGANPAQRRIATLFPDSGGPAHFISHYDLSANVAGLNRYMVIAPEEVKPLSGRTIAFTSRGLDNANKRYYLDGLEVFYHTKNTATDMSTENLGDEGAPGSHTIQLRHRGAGTAFVQCYWQIPADADTATIASEPIRIDFQE